VRIVEVGELFHPHLGDELIRALAPDRTKRCRKPGNRERRRRQRADLSRISRARGVSLDSRTHTRAEASHSLERMLASARLKASV
jgi:hypothetical protein